jgi:hypothetical protein
MILRETFIALRAQRKAHQVAADIIFRISMSNLSHLPLRHPLILRLSKTPFSDTSATWRSWKTVAATGMRRWRCSGSSC